MDRLDIGGLRIAVRREGLGPPVVLLHGFFGDHRVWRPQGATDGLTARTYPVGDPGVGVDRTSAPSSGKAGEGGPRLLPGRLGHVVGLTREARPAAADGDRQPAWGRATNHCLNGADASIEELLDWRPSDYFTFRNTIPTPTGAIRMLETTDFEPTPDGTIVRLRFATPKSAKERALMRQMESFLDQAIQASGVLLTEQLEVELERRRLEGGEDPDLSTPRPDGPLAGLSPAP